MSPFLHIWVVDSSFFSCFRKTTRLTLVQNCHQSSVGCSIDFRLANIILERLKLAWSKENQTGKKWWQGSCKSQFYPGQEHRGLIEHCKSLSLLHLAESVYIFGICQLGGCATDKGGTLLGVDTPCNVKRIEISLSEWGCTEDSACPPRPAFSWVPSDRIFRYELFNRP